MGGGIRTVGNKSLKVKGVLNSTCSILKPSSEAAIKPVTLRVKERTLGSEAVLQTTVDMKSSRHGQASSRDPPS